MSEENKDYKLPTPEFPKMEMPESPKTDRPEGAPIQSCDGGDNELMVYDTPSPVKANDDGRLRIMIGIPILTYSHEFVQSFMKFWTQLCLMEEVEGKKPFQVGYHFMYRKPVHMAELELVKIAQWNKCTHILLMDDDIYDVTVADLQKLVDAKKEVIGGVMYASKFPYAMCVFRRYDTNKKVIDMPADNSMFRLYEVPCHCTQCGFGLSHWDAKFCPVCGAANDNVIQKADLIPFPFTLIDLKVFDKIKKPWFHCTEGYPTDSWFCDRCHEAGIPIYAHMGVRLNHNGVSDVTRGHLFNLELEKRKTQQNPGIVPISEADMEKHQFILHQKMQEAEAKCRPQVEFVDIKEASNECKKSSVPEDVRVQESVKVSG